MLGVRVCGGRVWLFSRMGEARVAGSGAARDGGRVWATGRGVGREGQGRGLCWGSVVLGWRLLCRSMCPLAAVRLCGHL